MPMIDVYAAAGNVDGDNNYVRVQVLTNGGWRLSGHANTNEELITAARHALR
jgi:hypothetical protein